MNVIVVTLFKNNNKTNFSVTLTVKQLSFDSGIGCYYERAVVKNKHEY